MEIECILIKQDCCSRNKPKTAILFLKNRSELKKS